MRNILKCSLIFMFIIVRLMQKTLKNAIYKEKVTFVWHYTGAPSFYEDCMFWAHIYRGGRGRRWGDMKGKARGETSRSCPRTVMPS